MNEIINVDNNYGVTVYKRSLIVSYCSVEDFIQYITGKLSNSKDGSYITDLYNDLYGIDLHSNEFPRNNIEFAIFCGTEISKDDLSDRIEKFPKQYSLNGYGTITDYDLKQVKHDKNGRYIILKPIKPKNTSNQERIEARRIDENSIICNNKKDLLYGLINMVTYIKQHSDDPCIKNINIRSLFSSKLSIINQDFMSSYSEIEKISQK